MEWDLILMHLNTARQKEHQIGFHPRTRDPRHKFSWIFSHLLDFNKVVRILKDCELAIVKLRQKVCPIRDIKNRILQFSKPPILEFKRLQKAFKIKKQGLQYFLK